MNRKLDLRVFQSLVTATIAAFAGVASAELYINEIYFSTPSMLDATREYVELRGTPGMSLNNHYLIFVENTDSLGASGSIEHVFDLNTRSMGTNGFLTLRQKSNPYTVASGTTDLVNAGPGFEPGFGSGTSGLTPSTIGASDGNANGRIENSGFTAMLIRNDGGVVPVLGLDLDDMNNGMDVSTGRVNWTILDSIGFLQQTEAVNSRSYAMINFGPASVPANHLEPGATFVGLGYEIELLARWGNSTGQTAADWHISNLTNNAASGYQANSSNFRQSAPTHPSNDGNPNTPPPQPSQIESTQGVPYGTILTNTLGAPNFLSGDYNKDGVVNAADYVVWRKTLGQTGSDTVDRPADGNHDYVVGPADLTVWEKHFNQPFVSGPPIGSGSASQSSSIPEPTAWILAVVALLGATQLRNRQSV